MNKLLIIVGVLFVLAIQSTYALRCYSCVNCGSESSSWNSTECMAGLDTCMSTSINYPGGSLKTKSCIVSSACKETNYGLAGYGFFIGCCTTDNCNSASGLVPKYIPLVASIVLFFALFFQKN
jgi:hypothetical protein